MNKNLLLKTILLFAVFCHFFNKASAQYAIGGTAPNGLTSKVYWLTWNTATLASYPAGFSNTQIVPSQATGDYVWQYSPTVRIKATMGTVGSSFTFGNGETKLVPYTPGTFYTDGLDVLFNGNGNSAKASSQGTNTSSFSRGVPYSAVANGSNGGQVQFNVSIRVEILINGVWTDTPYPGMVLADAESMATGEFIQAITESSGTGAIGWQLLAYRQGPILGAYTVTNQTDNYVINLLTAPGSTTIGSQFRLQVNSGAGDYNVQAVLYAHGVNALKM